MNAEIFKRLDINFNGRDFIVGDIHGNLGLLDCLSQAAEFDERHDRLLALGDLVDRGADSEKVVDRFRTKPNLFSIRGNHEALLLAAVTGDNYARAWVRNGGRWGVNLSAERLQEIASFVNTLPYALEVPLADGRRVGLIHAEVAPGNSWDDIEKLQVFFEDTVDDEATSLAASALWGRKRLSTIDAFERDPLAKSISKGARLQHLGNVADVEGIDVLYVGHSVMPGYVPVRAGNTLYVDTGAWMPLGRLTLVEPARDRFWQAEDRFSPRLVSRNPIALPDPVRIPDAYRSSTRRSGSGARSAT